MAGLSDKQHAFVAAYLGPARMNATEAASLAGYAGNRVTLASVGRENLEKPQIKAAIDQWREEVKHSGIADVSLRVQNLDGMLQDFYQIKHERAQEWAELEQKLDERADTRKVYDDQFGGLGTKVPAGAGTGWVVRQIKMVGSGPSARIVEEFGVDTSLVDRIIKVQEEAAKELGQRQEKVDVSGSLKREYVIVREDETTPVEVIP